MKMLHSNKTQKSAILFIVNTNSLNLFWASYYSHTGVIVCCIAKCRWDYEFGLKEKCLNTQLMCQLTKLQNSSISTSNTNIKYKNVIIKWRLTLLLLILVKSWKWLLIHGSSGGFCSCSHLIFSMIIIICDPWHFQGQSMNAEMGRGL